MAGFEKLKADLDAVGARVFAASVDPVDKAGYGVTREIADKLGSWWEERRSIVQPSEFIIDASGKVLTASYSDGPLGRIDAADVIKFINFREAQSRK